MLLNPLHADQHDQPSTNMKYDLRITSYRNKNKDNKQDFFHWITQNNIGWYDLNLYFSSKKNKEILCNLMFTIIIVEYQQYIEKKQGHGQNKLVSGEEYHLWSKRLWYGFWCKQVISFA